MKNKKNEIQESENRKIIREKSLNDDKNKEEENNEIAMTQIELLKETENEGTLYELNKSKEKKDIKIEEDKKEPNQKNESFFQKTKKWAGNVWSYVNIANYFPKTEFKEYRNFNGDWVKIPVKKIPLKKKKNK